MLKVALGAAMLVAAGSAMAWPADQVSDPFGAGAISRSSYTGVQPRLQAMVDKGDRRPEVLLNLAAIRMGQDHAADAQALYREVLAQPNVDLQTMRGTAWSHDIARRGLANPRVAAR
jgi:hypothetical protein